MSQGTVLGLIVGVAALLAVAFFWTSDSTPEASPADERLARRRMLEDEGGADGAGHRSSGSRARSESRRGSEGGGGAERRERMDRSEGGNSRRLAPAIGGAHRNADTMIDDSRSGRPSERQRGKIAMPPRLNAEDGRAVPELPDAKPQDPNQQVESDEDAAEPPAEPIREVAFEGGDRLFDTGQPTEVKEAGRISPDGGVVSFWIQPGWDHNREDSADLMKLGETGMQVLKEGTFLRFEYVDPAGNEQGGDADIGHWQDGEWHHVVATWTRNSMQLYVDGGQAFINQGIERPDANTDPGLFVGSQYPQGTGIALAAMSDLSIINKPATQEEIKKIFEAGGPAK